jgi:hypothetical protein
MDDEIVVKYVKIDGQTIEDPVPKFEYEVKTGRWTIIVEAEAYADILGPKHNQQVEVEIGMQLGTVRDVGIIKTWSSVMPDAPSFIAKIEGREPMNYVDTYVDNNVDNYVDNHADEESR